MTNTTNSLTDSQLAALTSGDGNTLDAAKIPAFRAALVARGYGDTDTADIPEREWNRALDAATA